MREISLAVVGADFANPDRSKSNRRFEIALCAPGDPVTLVLEPKNPADPNAVAVFSERGIQLGYLTAERAPLIRIMVRDEEVRAIFQSATRFGAVIRATFDGSEPTLPAATEKDFGPDHAADPASGFYPDYIPPDD